MWHYTTHFSRPGCMETPTLLMHKADAIPVKKDVNVRLQPQNKHIGCSLCWPICFTRATFMWGSQLPLNFTPDYASPSMNSVASSCLFLNNANLNTRFFLKLLLIYLLNLRWYFAGSTSLSRRIFMIQMTSGSKSTGSKILKISMEWSTFLTIKKKCF